MKNQYEITRTVILIIVVAIIAVAIYYLDHKKVDVRGTGFISTNVTATENSTTTSTEFITNSLKEIAQNDNKHGFQLAKEINQPSGFINTPKNSPITISQYIGKKVILIDFWTYSCINCQRTTPYLNAWYEKYEKDGFVIIGVHTPEFDFEKVYDNVKKAVTKEGIKFPVVMDNNYATWTSYQNQYWPHKYLIDLAGYVVYDNIGEGAYDTTEKKIQELLTQRKQIFGDTSNIDTAISVPKNAVTIIQTQSPETYFGSARNQYLANGKQNISGIQSFTLPQSFGVNALYLGGTWNIQNQEADAQSDVSVVYTFNAKEVYFVAGSDSVSDIEILLDGT